MSRAALARAWQWVTTRHDRWFLPGHRPVSEEIKTLGELGLAAEMAARSPARLGLDDDSQPRAILRDAWAALDSGARIVELIDADPQEAVLALCAAPFLRSGFESAALLSSLRRAAPVMAPERALFAAAAFREIGIEQTALDWSALAATSWLARRLPPWEANERHLYVTVHMVGYYTRYGHERGGVPDDLRDYLVAWLPPWCEHVQRRWNMDLLSELILAHHLIGLPSPERSWSELVRSQRDNGSIPDCLPGWRNSEADEFARDHHPTLTFLMAGATREP